MNAESCFYIYIFFYLVFTSYLCFVYHHYRKKKKRERYNVSFDFSINFTKITALPLLSTRVEFIGRFDSFLIRFYFATKVLAVLSFHLGNWALNFLAALRQPYRREYFAILNLSLSLYT